MGRKSRLRQAKKNENEWSRVDLPSPPQFNGTNFSIWTSRMRVYLRYVDTHVDMNDEAKDALALHLIHRAVDDILMQKIAAAKTSKEAMNILEEEFSERGSCLVEAAIVADEEDGEVVIEASFSEAEHDQEACRESHNAVKHMDDENSESYSAGAHVDGEDETAIAAAKSVGATQEVAGQPAEAEVQMGDEANYDKEILSDEELQKLRDEMKKIAGLWNGKIPEFENSEEESRMEAAKMSEDVGSHIAASEELENSLRGEKNEKNQYGSCFEFSFRFDDLSSFVSGQPAKEMDEHEEDVYLAENILMKWSLEEIRHYYRLMWQQATEEEESAMKTENIILDHNKMKIEFAAPRVMGLRQSNDEVT